MTDLHDNSASTPGGPGEADASAENNGFDSLLGRHLRAGKGHLPALVTDTAAISYAELAARSAQIAGKLAELGVTAGDRVLTFAPDSVELVALVFASWRFGAVPVLCNQLAPKVEVDEVMRQTEPALIAMGSFAAERMPHIADRAFRLDKIADGTVPLDAEALDVVTAVRPGDAAVWQFTQLYDGHMRPVVHPHRAINNGAEPFGGGVLGLTSSDICYSIAKLYFGYGFGNAMVLPLSAGGCAVIDDGRPVAYSVLDRIDRLKPTVFFAVPTFYAGMLDVPQLRERWDLTSVRMFVSAGEQLPPALRDKFEDLFEQPLIDGIGSTEMFHIFISTRPGVGMLGGLGMPTPGHSISLRDEADAEVAQGSAGRLWVRGPHNGIAYAGDPERSAKTFIDGWVKTNDLLRQHTDGSYEYMGRTDGVPMVGGQKVVLSEIDATLGQHPDVVSASTWVEFDAAGIAQLRTRVRLRPGVPLRSSTKRQLRAFLRERLLPHKCPRYYELQ